VPVSGKAEDEGTAHSVEDAEDAEDGEDGDAAGGSEVSLGDGEAADDEEAEEEAEEDGEAFEECLPAPDGLEDEPDELGELELELEELPELSRPCHSLQAQTTGMSRFSLEPSPNVNFRVSKSPYWRLDALTTTGVPASARLTRPPAGTVIGEKPSTWTLDWAPGAMSVTLALLPWSLLENDVMSVPEPCWAETMTALSTSTAASRLVVPAATS